MDWEIKPFYGVGPIVFGMRRDEVRRSVGSRFREFTKSALQPLKKVDAFEELLVHVYYGVEDDACEFVEFAGGHVMPIFRGRRLLEEPFVALRGWLRTVDSGTVEDESGIECPNIGLSLYCPDAEERPGRTAEAASVYRAGYR